jgi:flagellar hook assembly protein FlgD
VNYPNPFTSQTRFVFTLTGYQVPEFFRIQIMTVTGKVVKEINKSELGPIAIGRNITEYAWDGTDQYGDPLANGLYLYRIITRLNNQVIDHYETSADKYFKNNIGKMYLMR